MRDAPEAKSQGSSEAHGGHQITGSRDGAHASWRWCVAALAVIVLGLALVYGEIWRTDPSSWVPVAEQADAGWQEPTRMDVMFGAWLASRNARALVAHPGQLFHTEHCAPWENMLTLGTPSITMGVLAVPAWLATGDPVLSYNVALLLRTLIAALAMFVLVAEWTRLPLAGIAAALLYAFHPVQLAFIHHANVWDLSWTLFALFFARRWLAGGRWRDAIGFSLATALQIAACFYPLVTAIFLSAPFGAWLIWRYGLRQVALGQWVLAGVVIGLAAFLVYGPYVEARDGTEILRRADHYFADAAYFLPGGSLFVGWLTLALAACALGLGRQRSMPALGADPRWAIALGGFFIVVMASGALGKSVLWFAEASWLGRLNPYSLIAAQVPGFDSIRAVWRLGAGLQLALTLLAGLGVAALIRVAGRRGLYVGLALVALAGIDVLRAPELRLERGYRWKLEAIRPSSEKLAFFERLDAMGNAGPLFEVPAHEAPFLGAKSAWPEVMDRVLLSAYHQRRTSACFGSFHAPGKERLDDIARRLPSDLAVRELHELGFTTLIVHHANGGKRRVARWLAEIGRRDDAPLRLLHRTPQMTAIEIREGADASGDASSSGGDVPSAAL